ncbi:MAG: GNAT family N-acetyltransferase [Lachnospiraceae bacterium]|nr:GNAT family N-acetyltransferase [Lachnospiraceae bacterium]
MEQVLKAQEAERKIRKRIETAFGLCILNGEAVTEARQLWEEAFPEVSKDFLDYYFEQRVKDNIVFAIKNDTIQSILHLTPYSAAMRRNPPLPGAGRLPCMADVLRVDTNVIHAAATQKAYRNQGYMRKVLTGALEYQRERQIPFCLAEPENGEFFEHFGFHYIYDRPQYELNTEIISMQMLKRAADGETVHLNPSNITLTAADKDSLLSLAHFVNANLCRHYGLFNIRSAAYYERFLSELQTYGGNLYQIMENGKRKGYFAYTQEKECSIREAVFENESDIDRYFYTTKGRKPAVMARIVNLPEILKHVAAHGKVTIAIRLKDSVIAENDGLFLWYLDEKGSRMERVEETKQSEETSMRPEVTVTIGEFTAFLFEYIKLKQNMKFDSIYLSGPAWINERY